MGTKQKKKPLQVSDLIKIEKKLHDKYSNIVNKILDLVKKESKKGKLKTQADRLKIIEKELVKIDAAIEKQTKLEKKAAKKANKKSEKRKEKATKEKAAAKESPANAVAMPETKAVAVPPKSTDLNAKTAIASLQKITDAEDVKKFISGEQRNTVLARANSRINALS